MSKVEEIRPPEESPLKVYPSVQQRALVATELIAGEVAAFLTSAEDGEGLLAILPGKVTAIIAKIKSKLADASTKVLTAGNIVEAGDARVSLGEKGNAVVGTLEEQHEKCLALYDLVFSLKCTDPFALESAPTYLLRVYRLACEKMKVPRSIIVEVLMRHVKNLASDGSFATAIAAFNPDLELPIGMNLVKDSPSLFVLAQSKCAVILFEACCDSERIIDHEILKTCLSGLETVMCNEELKAIVASMKVIVNCADAEAVAAAVAHCSGSLPEEFSAFFLQSGRGVLHHARSWLRLAAINKGLKADLDEVNVQVSRSQEQIPAASTVNVDNMEAVLVNVTFVMKRLGKARTMKLAIEQKASPEFFADNASMLQSLNGGLTELAQKLLDIFDAAAREIVKPSFMFLASVLSGDAIGKGGRQKAIDLLTSRAYNLYSKLATSGIVNLLAEEAMTQFSDVVSRFVQLREALLHVVTNVDNSEEVSSKDLCTEQWQKVHDCMMDCNFFDTTEGASWVADASDFQASIQSVGESLCEAAVKVLGDAAKMQKWFKIMVESNKLKWPEKMKRRSAMTWKGRLLSRPA